MASNAFVATDHKRRLLGPAPNPVASGHVGVVDKVGKYHLLW